MDYKRIYDQLIQKRRDNPITRKEQYVECHHIMPKSEGGNDDESNLVNLTAREHYVAHLLLARIYNDYKMWAAVWGMATGWRYYKKTNHTVNSRTYEIVRENFVKSLRKHMLGGHLSDDTKRKISKATMGRNPWNKGKSSGFEGHHHSEEHKQKISRLLTGRIFSDEHKRKISEAKKGKHLNLSEGARRRLSERMRNRVVTAETRRKIILINTGRKHSEETRRKISEAKKRYYQIEDNRKKHSTMMKGRVSPNKGLHVFNDGKKMVYADICPSGFVEGRLKKVNKD